MVLHLVQQMCYQWKGQKVLGWCDNTATIAAINKGRSR